MKRIYIEKALTLINSVATVLTVYGIETSIQNGFCYKAISVQSQQYLPFTVLKQPGEVAMTTNNNLVATVLTVYGIETIIIILLIEY